MSYEHGYYSQDYSQSSNRQYSQSSNLGLSKQEEDLAIALKKALTPQEEAPKQKHVRSCILYTWDRKGSGNLFDALCTFPMLSTDVIAFKALILYHKVIRQGHANALRDQYEESKFLRQVERTLQYQAGNYGQLMRDYIAFLKLKLDYHKTHPYFSGTFDYEEYVSLRGIEDPNEGYETIGELLDLLAKIDQLQKHIFQNLRSYGNNEARIAALVPLVEESDGIYRFINSMMTAMHTIIGSVEVLGPLRDQCKQTHYKLLNFYNDCVQFKYLTSLIAIPKLSHDAPDFLNNGPPTKAPSKKQDMPNRDEEMLRREREELERYERENEKRKKEQEYMKQKELELEQKRLQEQQLLRDQEMERLRLQQLEQQKLQQQQFLQQQMTGAQHQLEYFQKQAMQDKEMLFNYEQKIQQLNSQLQQLSLQQQNVGEVEKLREEIASWKQKYEALAKLYSQLRKEHLDLLTKFKGVKDFGSKATEEARVKVEAMQHEVKKKQSELTDALVERNRIQKDLDGIKAVHDQEIDSLRRELESSKASLQQLSLSQGEQVSGLVASFQEEQAKLEQLLQRKQQEIDLVTRQLGDVVSAMEKAKMNYQEETNTLQGSLNQALELLKQHQEVAETGMSTRDERIEELEGKHQQLLNGMMDNVLSTCVRTVSDQLFLLDSADDGRKMKPEMVLALIEKVQQKATEFSASMVKLVNAGDPKDAISSSASFAQSVAILIRDGREITNDQVLNILRQGGNSVNQFFMQCMSEQMTFIQPSQRGPHIIQLCRETQQLFGLLVPTLESLVATPEVVGDLADAVEQSMNNAASAIEAAQQRLQALLAVHGNMSVHSAILQAANAITTAITHLIKCATVSQQEIAASQPQTSSTAFYKKNSKWTQGLISAANSVSDATVSLVEHADQLIVGKTTWEHVVVRAQEVGVATTQLVAAARVKAALYSKSQGALENAAVKVREATKLLVKAAQDASKMQTEEEVAAETRGITKHEAKVREMEQQVKILELEKELGKARFALGAMRKAGYREEE